MIDKLKTLVIITNISKEIFTMSLDYRYHLKRWRERKLYIRQIYIKRESNQCDPVMYFDKITDGYEIVLLKKKI